MTLFGKAKKLKESLQKQAKDALDERKENKALYKEIYKQEKKKALKKAAALKAKEIYNKAERKAERIATAPIRRKERADKFKESFSTSAKNYFKYLQEKRAREEKEAKRRR